MVHLLDNIFWHALTGPQAHWAVGSGGIRRYAPGFSPIVGFANPQRPDFDALTPHCGALGLYQRMGFRIHRELVVRVIARV